LECAVALALCEAWQIRARSKAAEDRRTPRRWRASDRAMKLLTDDFKPGDRV